MDECNKRIYEMAEEVYKNLGTGHTEFIYHSALEIELRNAKYDYEREKRVLINYKGYTLGEERIDLFIRDNNTIIELKAVINPPREIEIAQIYKYYNELKKAGINCKYGIIINFPQAGTKSAKDTIDFYEIKFENK